MSTLKYTKVRKVKSPNRAHSSDAGIDFYVPEDLTTEVLEKSNEKTPFHGKFIQDADTGSIKIVLSPGESVLIPSGIKVNVPDGYMLMYDNKSGVSSKKGLLVGAKIVDIGYQGECHLDLHNVTNQEQTICSGDKICQGILVKIGFQSPEEVSSEEELYNGVKSERGEGGFGSSDNVSAEKTDSEVKTDDMKDDIYGNSNNPLKMSKSFLEFKTLDGNPCIIRIDKIQGIEEVISDTGTKHIIITTSTLSYAVIGSIASIRAYVEGWIEA